MPKDLVTIIIPCYQQARYLPESVASVQRQTHSNWECIIVNDGSVDNTQEVAERLAQSDSRIRCVQQPNSGLSAARNRGLEDTSGRYVQFLDADDTIRDNKLELQLASIPDTSRLVVSYTDYICYSESADVQIPESYSNPRLDTANPLLDLARRFGRSLGIPVHSFLFDARAFTEHGVRFDPELTGWEDFACWLRVLRLDPVVVKVDEQLALYRWHQASMCRDAGRMRRGLDMALRKAIVDFRDDPLIAQVLADRLGLPLQYVYGEMNGLGRAIVRLRLMRSAITGKLIPSSVRSAIKGRFRG